MRSIADFRFNVLQFAWILQFDIFNPEMTHDETTQLASSCGDAESFPVSLTRVPCIAHVVVNRRLFLTVPVLPAGR